MATTTLYKDGKKMDISTDLGVKYFTNSGWSTGAPGAAQSVGTAPVISPVKESAPATNPVAKAAISPPSGYPTQTIGSQLLPGYTGPGAGTPISLAGSGGASFADTVMKTAKPENVTKLSGQTTAQNYIEKSRPGGMSTYEQTQRDRYKDALARNDVELINKLTADADRVGYSLTAAESNMTTADPTPTPAPDDYSWITDMVNNELGQQKAAIDQELARLKQESELAVNQNNTFLQDQIKKLEENRIQVGNEIVNFQNRRGGFYSGGVDFQTANNNKVYAEEEGKTTRDIAARNADIWARNTLLAQQAADNLQKLTSQAPDRIRQLIEEQKRKDAGAALDANKFALETDKFNWDVTKDTQDLNIRDRAQTLDETELFATLTGFLPDGTPTNEYQQQILDNAWKTITEIGVVPASLAPIVGVPAGTKTQDAIKVAIQQQNANTSAKNAETTRINANKPKEEKPKTYSYKTDPEFTQEVAFIYGNPAGALAEIQKNATELIATYTYDGYKELERLAKAAAPKK